MSSSKRLPSLIGILRTDSVRDELRAEHQDYPQMFVRLCALAGLEPSHFVAIDARENSLPDISCADAYLITGSKHSVYDPLPWIPRLAQFVADALESKRPVVGICFGHQLLAHYFGGKVGPAEQGWQVGVKINEVVAQQAWMQPSMERLAMISSHQDQVLELPPGARLLATHEQCPIAGFSLPEGALALQGHPEFDKAYTRALLQARATELGERVVQEALDSLAEPTNSEVVAHWLCHFFAHSLSKATDE